MASLFTVEQIELIRRLRLSGVTTQQIIEAFQTFDRLDQELPSANNPRLNHNASTILPHMLAAAAVNHNPFTSSPNNTSSIFNTCPPPVSSTNGVHHMPKLSAVYPPIFPHPTSMASPMDIVSMLTTPPTMVVKEDAIGNNACGVGVPPPVDFYTSGPSVWPSSERLNHNPSPKPLPRASLATPSTASKTKGSSEHSTPVASAEQQKTPIRVISEKLDLNDPELLADVNEMMTREDCTILEMREYVTSHQLRQQAIAHMCGISQPYVSKFLNGSFRELSERVRRIIFYWYAKSKKNSPDYMRVVVDSSGEPAQLKRERFIFKPVHVRLLEKYFQQDPYPNISKREEMARILNHAYLAHKGTVSLDEKEVVTEHVVGTWFSNRRKEKKRRDLKFRQMRIHQNGGQKSLLHQFLNNLRQSALERNGASAQSAITIDNNIDDEIDETNVEEMDKRLEHSPLNNNIHLAEEILMEQQNGQQVEYSEESGLQYQLEAVNNSVFHLLNPYNEETLAENGRYVDATAIAKEEMIA